MLYSLSGSSFFLFLIGFNLPDKGNVMQPKVHAERNGHKSFLNNLNGQQKTKREAPALADNRVDLHQQQGARMV